MSSQELCGAAERKILEAQRMLLDPRPEVLAECELELAQVAELLQSLGGDSRDWNPGIVASFRRIQLATRRLKVQVDHASNLWRGWLQLRFGAGYTGQGLPLFEPYELRSSLEA